MRAKHRCESLCGRPPWPFKATAKAEFLHCVYSSLRESATTFAVESLKLVRGVTFDLLLLGTVLSLGRLHTDCH